MGFSSTDHPAGQLEEQFQDYVKRCWPGETLSPGMLKDLRQTFFAGAATYMFAIEAMTKVPEEQGFKILTAINEEVEKACLKYSGKQEVPS